MAMRVTVVAGLGSAILTRRCSFSMAAKAMVGMAGLVRGAMYEESARSWWEAGFSEMWMVVWWLVEGRCSVGW